MNSELRDKQKKHGLKRFINSFGYSIDGLKYAYRYEQSMLVHMIAATMVIVVGLIVKLNLIEWLICFILMGLVMATELINTAIEAVVDLTCPKIDPLAKIAKDTASAAVFVFSVVAFISGMIIFVPNVLDFLATI